SSLRVRTRTSWVCSIPSSRALIRRSSSVEPGSLIARRAPSITRATRRTSRWRGEQPRSPVAGTRPGANLLDYAFADQGRNAALNGPFRLIGGCSHCLLELAGRQRSGADCIEDSRRDWIVENSLAG